MGVLKWTGDVLLAAGDYRGGVQSDTLASRRGFVVTTSADQAWYRIGMRASDAAFVIDYLDPIGAGVGAATMLKIDGANGVVSMTAPLHVGMSTIGDTGAEERLFLQCVGTGVVGPIARWSRTAATARTWQIRLNAAGGFEIVDETGGAVRLAVDTSGYVSVASRFAFNGKTPIASVAAPTAAGGTYTATEQAAINGIITRLTALGVYT